MSAERPRVVVVVAVADVAMIVARVGMTAAAVAVAARAMIVARAMIAVRATSVQKAVAEGRVDPAVAAAVATIAVRAIKVDAAMIAARAVTSRPRPTGASRGSRITRSRSSRATTRSSEQQLAELNRRHGIPVP
jgi:hypothetical protein